MLQLDIKYLIISIIKMENDRFILNRNSDVKVIYIGTGQFQLASGKWVDAILYKYRGVYKMMEASEFIGLAEPDRSTTLDHIGDIISTGYTPGFAADKTHIPAEEVECDDIDDIDIEQNDSSNDEEDFDKTIKLNKNVSKFA